MYTNGPKNTLKSLLSPLHLKIFKPKTANELLYFCSVNIPFILEFFEMHKIQRFSIEILIWNVFLLSFLNMYEFKVHTTHAKQ